MTYFCITNISLLLQRVSVAHEGLQQQVAVAQPTSTLANNVDQLQGNENPNNCQNEIKAVPSAYCEVCKVDCKSKEVLDQHKLGKKHKKRLEVIQFLLSCCCFPTLYMFDLILHILIIGKDIDLEFWNYPLATLNSEN